jgi:YHS domain-containing protein
MKSTPRILLRLILGATLAWAGIFACEGEEPSRGSAQPAARAEHAAPAAAASHASASMASAEELAPVDRAELVCMVTNRKFESAQIPVAVEGRTYYGCCEGCKATLESDPEARFAVDPVTGARVDKSRATFGALPDGRILYFESPETRARWKG